jgi:hypothetical protein
LCFIVALRVLHEAAIPLAAQRATMTRLRSEHPAIAAAIVAATDHSVTFRAMVEALKDTDGIVYVRDGRCRTRLRACLAGVHSAPPVRFLNITVDTRRSAGCELMASLGHELQHAVEVLSNPTIVDNQSLQHFYMREGATGDAFRLETTAAVGAGRLVGSEVSAASICGQR